MRAIKVYDKVFCQGCRRMRAVNNDGTIRWHGTGGHWSPKCPGSRRKVEAPLVGALWV